MDWRLKAMTQSVLGVLPWGHRLHSKLQQRFGGQADFRVEVLDRFESWVIMADTLASAGLPKQHSSVLEMGTGWYPLLPMCLYATGSKSIQTTDVARLCRTSHTIDALGYLLDSERVQRELERYDSDAISRLQQLSESLIEGRSLMEATSGNLQYQAPALLEACGIADQSIQLAFSNNVLGHVRPDDLISMHKELHRTLADDGVVYHSINCNDQYSHIDRSIHNLNYLRYSDRGWQRWNNSFLYQNRLRVGQFLTMLKSTGFQVVQQERHRSNIDLTALELADQFKVMDEEDVLTTSVTIVARKARAS